MDLAELSKASGVSPRTIRYYIHQGLLPSPGKRGRGARYDRALLPRLQLIQLLQRDAWPLVKIAQHMSELDDEAVRRELAGSRKREAGSGGSVLPRTSDLGPRTSLWRRVRVDPTLEINVRTTLSGKRRKRVDRLIESARQIFEER
jgi:DNA-binding transcriptional MerR regulator